MIIEYIDLSHTINDKISIFPSIPAPKITPFFTHTDSKLSGKYKDCSCEVTKVEFVTSIGTYLDSPFHFNPDGRDISRLELKELILEGICIKPGNSENKYINIDIIKDMELNNKALLIYTGFDKYWGKNEYYNHPYLSRDSANLLLDKKVKLVGIDTLILDNPADKERPVHNLLLNNNIFIVENLKNLGKIADKDFTFFAVPPKISRTAAFPVRAFAIMKH